MLRNSVGLPDMCARGSEYSRDSAAGLDEFQVLQLLLTENFSHKVLEL